MKNEPGAADYYYGEMEMRRKSSLRGEASIPVAEKFLLSAYWAVSGYGLRAWRAFAAIVLLILGTALVFSTVGFAEPRGTSSKAESINLETGQVVYPPQLHDGFGDALVLAARNSFLLLRTTAAGPELTAWGTAADITVRLLTPVLLGFALLAIRGRTKR
ncbi:hypothetical protein C5613_41430 [Rhodococcus opacus]|uniref:Uncharacterized protein n=2 Tax=Rhodococcus opacus TaxID=37919 RepID=A0A2S8IGX5_RHOOP|nr:hypothetical protein C5613_41430 [Rhodococcus opacus]